MSTTAPETPTTEAPSGQPGTAVADLTRSAALEIKGQQSWWTAAQRAALSSIGLADTPDGDLIAFLHLCQATGLDPFRREMYLIGRKDRTAPSGTKWTAQTGIDGFRFIAERTGEFLGAEDPEWCGPDGAWRDVWLDPATPPAAARVRVKRRNPDGGEPILTTGTVMYAEFVPMKDEWANNAKTGRQVPQGQWGVMPAHMLAKCAEAFAIRRAFPRQAAGVYLHEEMQKADEAAQQQAAADQAEARRKAREDAREQGVNRPWANRGGVVLGEPDQASSEPQEPASEPPADEGIVDAVLVPDEGPQVDREALFTELDEQAKTLNVNRASLTRRWAAQHRKNVEDATDEELLAVVLGYREMVASKRDGQQG